MTIFEQEDQEFDEPVADADFEPSDDIHELLAAEMDLLDKGPRLRRRAGRPKGSRTRRAGKAAPLPGNSVLLRDHVPEVENPDALNNLFSNRKLTALDDASDTDDADDADDPQASGRQVEEVESFAIEGDVVRCGRTGRKGCVLRAEPHLIYIDDRPADGAALLPIYRVDGPAIVREGPLRAAYGPGSLMDQWTADWFDRHDGLQGVPFALKVDSGSLDLLRQAALEGKVTPLGWQIGQAMLQGCFKWQQLIERLHVNKEQLSDCTAQLCGLPGMQDELDAAKDLYAGVSADAVLNGLAELGLKPAKSTAMVHLQQSVLELQWRRVLLDLLRLPADRLPPERLRQIHLLMGSELNQSIFLRLATGPVLLPWPAACPLPDRRTGGRRQEGRMDAAAFESLLLLREAEPALKLKTALRRMGFNQRDYDAARRQASPEQLARLDRINHLTKSTSRKISPAVQEQRERTRAAARAKLEEVLVNAGRPGVLMKEAVEQAGFTPDQYQMYRRQLSGDPILQRLDEVGRIRLTEFMQSDRSPTALGAVNPEREEAYLQALQDFIGDRGRMGPILRSRGIDSSNFYAWLSRPRNKEHRLAYETRKAQSDWKRHPVWNPAQPDVITRDDQLAAELPMVRELLRTYLAGRSSLQSVAGSMNRSCSWLNARLDWLHETGLEEDARLYHDYKRTAAGRQNGSSASKAETEESTPIVDGGGDSTPTQGDDSMERKNDETTATAPSTPTGAPTAPPQDSRQPEQPAEASPRSTEASPRSTEASPPRTAVRAEDRSDSVADAIRTRRSNISWLESELVREREEVAVLLRAAELLKIDVGQ